MTFEEVLDQAIAMLQRRGRLTYRTLQLHFQLDAAYQSLLRSTRQQYHQRIAQVLTGQFPDTAETQPELLAYHYTEAGLSAPALAHWQQASQRASARSAYIEATAHLHKGFAVLTTLPDTPERRRQELVLQVTLGVVLSVTKGYGDPDRALAYARALELCHQVGETPQLCPVLFGLCQSYITQGKFQIAHDVAEQLLRSAQPVHDAALLVGAYQALGESLFWPGELVTARQYLEHGIACYNPQQQTEALPYGEDIGVLCWGMRGWILWYLGCPDQALRDIDALLTLVQDVSRPFSRAFVLFFATVLHQLRREVQSTAERAQATVTLASERGFSELLALGTLLRGWALTGLGQGEEAIVPMDQGLTALRVAGSEMIRPYALALLAEAYGHIGQAEAGLRVLAEALAAVQQHGARHHEAELYRLKGELLLQPAVPDVPQAEACFQQALTIARRQQAKSLELRAAMSLARLWQRQGKRTAAYELLAPVYHWFTEGFDTADLQEARVLLDALSEGQG